MKRLDRYILWQYILTLLFSIIGLCVIFVVVHLLENLDGFLDKKLPFRVMMIFYLNFLPEIIKLITPVSLLLASLFTVGRLSQLNEITAMKTGGLSVYRIMLPLLCVGIVSSAGQLYFNGWMAPKANQHKAEIERKYLQKARLETSLYNVYLRESPTRNVLIRYYDDLSKTGSFISVEDYSSENSPRLLNRVDAPSFTFDTTRSLWRLHNGLRHDFTKELPTAQQFASDSLQLHITPQQLFQLQRGFEELTFPELREQIDISERGGKDVRKQRIEYYGQYALPFANLIVVLFGVLPLATGGRRKAGLALEITAAMTIAFFYMACVRIAQTLTYASPIPPIVGAWLANALFLIAGLFLVLRMRT